MSAKVQPDITKSQQRALDAFEVEIQTMLVRLRGLPPGVTSDVYLAPTGLLYRSQEKGAHYVGTYNARVPRADFWDDCHAEAEEQGWNVRPRAALAHRRASR